jgi:hypothetical protein
LKKTAVVILNYNGKKFLEDFLPAVIEKSRHIADIWVADNNSSDDSIELLKQKFPEVNIITNPENGGYASGYNVALKQIEAEYYILLNSDIEVTDNWIEPVISLMDTDNNIAACQPKILSFYETEKFEYAGAAGGFIDTYGYPFCRGRMFQNIETDNGQYDDAMEVFWASGACMFVRAELFHKYEGFDDDFFAHMEEIDLCWRMKNFGHKIMVCPESKVFHVGGGTLPKQSSWKTYLNFRNNFSLLYKNLPSNKLFKVFFFRLLLDGVAGLKFMLQGGFQDMFAVVKAHFYFYSNIGKLRKKRKKLKQLEVSHIYKGNIVIDHYLFRKRKYDELDKSLFSKTDI